MSVKTNKQSQVSGLVSSKSLKKDVSFQKIPDSLSSLNHNVNLKNNQSIAKSKQKTSSQNFLQPTQYNMQALQNALTTAQSDNQLFNLEKNPITDHQSLLNLHEIPDSHQLLQDQDNMPALSSRNYEKQQIRGYFSQFNQKNQLSKKIDFYQKTIFTNLNQQFDTGRLTIQIQRQFPLKSKQKTDRQQEDIMRQKLQIKRQQALSRIKEIQGQQLELKRRAISTHQRPLKRSHSVLMANIPQKQSKNQLKKALNEYKKFTSELQKRQQQIQHDSQQQKLMQLQKQEEIFRLRRQSRKEQVKSSLKKFLQKQQIRKSIIEEWKVKQKQIKNKKYLYIENRQRQSKLIQAQEIDRQTILDRIKNNHVFDKHQIEQHGKKYEERIQERKQLYKSMSSSSVTNRTQFKKYQTSKFGKIALKQIQDIKKKQLQKLMKVRQSQAKQKVLRYQQKINQQIRPNLHLKKFVPLPRSMSMQALEPEKHRELGIQYLQKAKKLKKSQDQLKLSQMKKQSEERLHASKSKNSYKDYLQDIKKDLKYDPSEKKLEQILRRKRTYSDFQSLTNAKYLSEYLVQKSKNTQNGKTMMAIQKKIDILNAIH